MRDRTLILVGFASALRRSELVTIDVDDVAEEAAGLILGIRRSKPTRKPKVRFEGFPTHRIQRSARYEHGGLDRRFRYRNSSSFPRSIGMDGSGQAG